MAFDTFSQRYAAFRAELHPREQRVFDRLLESARRHSNAINRRPHLDFERPVILSMLMEAVTEVDGLQRRWEHTQHQLIDTHRVLEEAGLVQRRPRRLSPQEMERLGQTRLT